MNFDKKDVLTLISLGVTIILGIFSKDVENPIVLIVVICVAVVVILGVMFFWKNREVRQLSNAGVIVQPIKDAHALDQGYLVLILLFHAPNTS